MVTLLPDEQSKILVPLNDLLSLQDAHIAGADLAQRPLNEAHVISLMMADPTSVPAIVLTHTEEYNLIIIDGYHRLEAAKRRKQATILANIRAFQTENELIEAAFEANLQHGLPASTTTRSDYVYWLFRTYPALSQKEIARRVGVKPSTVNVALKRHMREHQAAEAQKKRQASLIGWNTEDLEESDYTEAQAKHLTQIIRTYVRQSNHLYEQFKNMDSGARYWSLETAIAESDKMMLYRLNQFLESYLKDSLPPAMLTSLNPTPSRRTKKSLPTHTPDANKGPSASP
jgi:hypothetical protein